MIGAASAQPPRQQCASAVQARPHRADGTAQRRSGIGICQLLQIAQHDRLSIPHGQRDDRAAQRLYMPVAIDVSYRICLHRELRTHGRRIVVSKRHGLPDGSRPPRMIPGDAKQPQRDSGASRSITRRAVNHRDERLLDDVFGERSRPAHVRRETADDQSMPPIELGEGVAVTGGDSRHQYVVWRSRVLNHVRCRIRRPHLVFSWEGRKVPGLRTGISSRRSSG